MKTTVELPSDLVREVKLQAVRDGRKMKDTIAELLRQGLSASASRAAVRRHRVKLPLVQCRRSADISPEQIAELLTGQEIGWHHEAS